jgi:cytochrome c oxidase subunit 2
VECGGRAFLTLLAMGMFFWAGATYIHLFDPPANATPVFVTGKQWMWKVQHETGQREINSLHLPVGHPVKLIMTSEDVIHDFYVPAFRIHTDVLPDRYTTQWFLPTQIGTYHLFCSQYCGTAHSQMIGDIVVMSPSDFQAWLAGGPQQTPAQAGALLFQQLGCDACHRPDSATRAPQLAGLFGQPVHLDNGQTVTADENYIRESILNPSAKIVAGYQNYMPSFQGRVNEEELFDLVSYIQSLGPAPGQPSPGGAPPRPLPSAGTPVSPTVPTVPGSPSPGGTPGAGAGSAAAGEQLFTSQGCIGCHVPTGGGPGPSFAGLYGKQQQLTSGQTVTVDDAFLRECILNPEATRVQGFQPIMPSFQGRLSDAQVNDLIAYIKSLAGK